MANDLTLESPAEQQAAGNPRTVQHKALTELTRLVGESAAIEVNAQKQLQQATDRASRQLRTKVDELDQQQSLEQQTHDDEYALAQQSISDAFAAKTKPERQAFEDKRQKLEHEYEGSDRTIKKKYQDAVWLADSVHDSEVIRGKEAYTKLQRDTNEQREELVGLEGKAGKALHEFGQPDLLGKVAPDEMPAIDAAGVALMDEAAVTTALDTAKADFEARKSATESAANKLRSLPLAKLIIGVMPFLLGLLIVAGAAAIAKPWEDWAARAKPAGIYAGIALVVVVATIILLRGVAIKQIRRAYGAFVNAEANADAMLEHRLVLAAHHRDLIAAAAKVARDAEGVNITGTYKPLRERAKQTRDKRLAEIRGVYDAQVAKLKFASDASMQKSKSQQQQAQSDLNARIAARRTANQADHDRLVHAAQTHANDELSQMQQRWESGLIASASQAKEIGSSVNEDWTPATKFAPAVRFGEFVVDLKKIADEAGGAPSSRIQIPEPYKAPALLAFPADASLLIESDRTGRQSAIRVLQMTMTRLLTSLPPGRVRFTIFDPVGLGQSFAGFMHLADFDDALVGGRIWTEAEQIEQRLADLTDHMETVIQKYLRNEFATIDEYNDQAGELAEPYRFLVIADLPANFSEESMRRLASIAVSGPRCGVYILASRDTRVAVPGQTYLDDLRAHSSLIEHRDGVFRWKDDTFGRFTFTPDSPPEENALTQILHKVGQGAKEAKRVEVPFTAITPKPEQMWTLDSSYDVSVPVGRTGATRLQSFRFGRGVAQHVLLAGKTGSGKSTLLNVLITNLAMWYSPDQLEMYLVDFKRGVEFKPYATHGLPHAKAIAVESDREFGLSVLQRLDAEIGRRGEMYRHAGVQDVAGYRASRPNEALPRVLLIIDEFQEFFSEDDKLAQEASLLLDRLVRQGRAFGIHVILGSQTLGGQSGLPRSTMGQMAVRVALQCSEADSQLILGDANSAARLLSRPGEAIFNDAGGAIEANSPFQISWLSDELRGKMLERVQAKAADEQYRTTKPMVFEGNSSATLESMSVVDRLMEAHANIESPAAILGDPVAIKEPTQIVFRRQSGSNVLLIGQQDEQSLTTMIANLATLALANRKASFEILDGTPSDSPLAGSFTPIIDCIPNAKQIEFRMLPETMDSLLQDTRRRVSEADAESPPRFCFIYGLQRFRALRKTEDEYSFSMSTDDTPKAVTPDKALAEVLRDGPAVGVHIVVWADTMATVERVFDRVLMRELDNRVLFQMSASDSSNLIDSPAANKLGAYRAIAYSEEQGVMEKFRPFALPTAAWLERFCVAMK